MAPKRKTNKRKSLEEPDNNSSSSSSSSSTGDDNSSTRTKRVRRSVSQAAAAAAAATPAIPDLERAQTELTTDTSGDIDPEADDEPLALKLKASQRTALAASDDTTDPATGAGAGAGAGADDDDNENDDTPSSKSKKKRAKKVKTAKKEKKPPSSTQSSSSASADDGPIFPLNIVNVLLEVLPASFPVVLMEIINDYYPSDLDDIGTLLEAGSQTVYRGIARASSSSSGRNEWDVLVKQHINNPYINTPFTSTSTSSSATTASTSTSTSTNTTAAGTDSTGIVKGRSESRRIRSKDSGVRYFRYEALLLLAVIESSSIRFGVQVPIDALRGSKNSKVQRGGFKWKSRGAHRTEFFWKQIHAFLLTHGYLKAIPTYHAPVYEVTELGERVLRSTHSQMPAILDIIKTRIDNELKYLEQSAAAATTTPASKSSSSSAAGAGAGAGAGGAGAADDDDVELITSASRTNTKTGIPRRRRTSRNKVGRGHGHALAVASAASLAAEQASASGDGDGDGDGAADNDDDDDNDNDNDNGDDDGFPEYDPALYA